MQFVYLRNIYIAREIYILRWPVRNMYIAHVNSQNIYIYCAWAVRNIYLARLRLRNMYITYTYLRNIHIAYVRSAICILRVIRGAIYILLGQGTQFAQALSIFTIFQIHGGFQFSRLFSSVRPRVLRSRAVSG